MPDMESLCSQEPMMDGPQEVAADPKEVVHGPVHRENPLRVRSRLDATHLALALPRGLMRILRSIVFVLTGPVQYRAHHGAMRRRMDS
jgi:hypothetical protein